MRKNFKKLTALTLTVAMSMASTMTAFPAGTSASGDIGTGTGDYEGGEMQYPAISMTVPTSKDVTYIADPNDLISSTLSGDAAANSQYAGYKFQGNTGIYFKTKTATSVASGDGVYSSTSEVFDIINESAQDVQVTVSLEQTQDASGDIAYSDTGTFQTTDKAKKIYLALTDGTSTKALSGDVKATLSKELKGQKDNYEPSYDSVGGEYAFQLKSGDPVKAWNKASYSLTGAVNKNATWKDDVGFPNIKVTYSWNQSPADVAPSIAVKEYTVTAGRPVDVDVDMGRGTLAATGISSILNGYSNTNVNESLFTYANGKLTFASGLSTWFKGKGVSSANLTVTFDDSANTQEVIKLTIR